MSERTTFYLAARYSRRLELCGYQAQLEALGHAVSSRWLLGNHQAENDQLHRGADAERFAGEDLQDVRDADVLVAFTEAPRTSTSRGGRHVEFGYALGLGMPVVIVGPRENVFGCLVPQFDSWRDCLPHLLPMRSASRATRRAAERETFDRSNAAGRPIASAPTLEGSSPPE